MVNSSLFRSLLPRSAAALLTASRSHSHLPCKISMTCIHLTFDTDGGVPDVAPLNPFPHPATPISLYHIRPRAHRLALTVFLQQWFFIFTLCKALLLLGETVAIFLDVYTACWPMHTCSLVLLLLPPGLLAATLYTAIPASTLPHPLLS